MILFHFTSFILNLVWILGDGVWHEWNVWDNIKPLFMLNLDDDDDDVLQMGFNIWSFCFHIKYGNVMLHDHVEMNGFKLVSNVLWIMTYVWWMNGFSLNLYGRNNICHDNE